ncbi:SAM-dependent methyltransferase [Catalinimonas alkaloidigena]|uniref:methyltransferase domain-containing protein n=1 Tax=Catalinimonas alkaloidigena TaxID=1075417 RepID=UPI002405B536|nr:methyltransferase domain-containing protein [Catalinimonas alkaloidigena]MDF9799716.1 SAM-dependent methyltransferase [Catalinimonas alkaloidigena]
MKDKIYYKIIKSAINDKLLSEKNSILVICAGTYDKEVFNSLGFQNVTISNLDSRMKGNEFEPYQWSFQDAENITFATDHFDWVVVHAGLHHCYSPHKTLLEMLRVGKKGDKLQNWLTQGDDKIELNMKYLNKNFKLKDVLHSQR